MATAPALDLQQLNDRFAIPGVAQIVPGNDGQPKIRITSVAASAEIYLHGAHLTSWIPAGAEEVLFLSSKAQYRDGKAIRGGVPICFPWFNAKADDPKAPSHGFVRTKTWELDSITHEGNAIAVSLSTASDEATRKWWPYEFRAVQRITISSHLQMELTVTNTGAAPLPFQEALHTYYRVGNVRHVRLVGLDDVSYLDNTEGNIEKIQYGDNTFDQRIDNAYLNTETSWSSPTPRYTAASSSASRTPGTLLSGTHGQNSPAEWPTSATNGPTSSASKPPTSAPTPLRYNPENSTL
jgi:glucose-6-phosphate 1-epimerase